MKKDQTVLTDDMWERIEPLLSRTATDPGRTADNRLFLEALLWRLRTGSPWRDLLAYFGKVQKGFSGRIFSVLSDNFDLSVVSVDGTIMQAHAKASGSEKEAHTKASDVQKAV